MKPLTAGSEIDAWCTSCRMDLGHRIVAMVEGRPKRVECLTCGGQHNYRAPQSEREKPNGRPKRTRTTAAPRLTQRARAEQERVAEWEAHTAGKPADAFSRYSMNRRFAEGELVLHKKFGEGYVTDVMEDGKVSIMFRDGVRTLAHDHGG